MTFAQNGEPVETGGPEDRLLPWGRVQDIAGISRTTAWRMQQTGAFPSPVAVSAGRVAWWESELTAWKRARGEAPAMSRPGKSGRAAKKALTPPAEPRLPGMARRAPVRSATSTRIVVTQPELPTTPSADPPRPTAARRRSRPIDTSQIDFGF